MACLEGGAVAKGEMKVASMVVLMVLTFMISWMPYASLAMLVVYDPNVEIHPLVGTVPVYLAKSSTVYNPIIYIYLNKQVPWHHNSVRWDKITVEAQLGESQLWNTVLLWEVGTILW